MHSTVSGLPCIFAREMPTIVFTTARFCVFQRPSQLFGTVVQRIHPDHHKLPGEEGRARIAAHTEPEQHHVSARVGEAMGEPQLVRGHLDGQAVHVSGTRCMLFCNEFSDATAVKLTSDVPSSCCVLLLVGSLLHQARDCHAA